MTSTTDSLSFTRGRFTVRVTPNTVVAGKWTVIVASNGTDLAAGGGYASKEVAIKVAKRVLARRAGN